MTKAKKATKSKKTSSKSKKTASKETPVPEVVAAPVAAPVAEVVAAPATVPATETPAVPTLTESFGELLGQLQDRSDASGGDGLLLIRQFVGNAGRLDHW